MPRLTAEQLELRRHGVGSSDVPAIVGISPWATAADVYWAKVDGSSQETTEAMNLGHELEPVIIRAGVGKIRDAAMMEAFTLCTGTTIITNWRIASLDAILMHNYEGFPLEAKLVGAHSLAEWDDGVPEHVTVQVQWQLEVTGASRGFVAALLGGTRLEVYRIERDRALGDDLVAACGAFWRDNVLARVPPDVAPRHHSPKRPTSDVAIPATPEIEEAAADLCSAKAAAKGADEAKARLMALLSKEGATVAVLSSGARLRWREQPGRPSWERAARAVGVTSADAFRGPPFSVITVG